MPNEALSRAIKRAGSEEKLGKAIGYSQHAIWKAKKRGRVTAEMARAIGDWSENAIAPHDLRPDIFPVPAAAAPEAA